MKISKTLRLLLPLVAASVFALSPFAAVAAVPSAPNPPRLVNDLAGIFTPSQVRLLEDSLSAFDRATSIQIVVVTMADLGSYAPSQMAFQIMDSWGVGQKGKNNGIVMLLKPRNSHGRGEVFIATGLGLEGVIPDGRATRMVDQVMMSYLQRGDYYGAVETGAQALRDMTRGEYMADAPSALSSWSVLIGFLVIIVLVIVLSVYASKHKNDDPSNNQGKGGGGGVSPFLWILLGSLSSRGGGGSSGGGFGGSSGGGFGGFGGGGSFGGGGGRSF